MKPGSFDVIASMLYCGSGLVITPDKEYLLDSRLAPVLKANGLANLDMLADRLRFPSVAGIASASSLENQVIEAMTTNESFFFRDDKPFTHFRTQALPRLLATRPAETRLRIWSAASSSGQEAYSLAMILAEQKEQLGGRTVECVATDISRNQLIRAQNGLYTQFEVQRGLPMQYLVKYFRKDGANWRVQDNIRAMVQFKFWNLLSDIKPLGQFDVVFCRNILIYFDQPTKARVLEAIARQMAPDGLLYLGGAETVLGITDAFGTVAYERGVYERTRAVALPSMAMAAR